MKRLNWRMAVAALAFTACGEAGDSNDPVGPGAEEGLQIVQPGKEDNFLSQSAQEYMLTGTTTVTLEDRYAGEPFDVREARARELVPFRQTVIGWFLNSYMIEKSHDATNKEHGGFKALTKNGSWEDLALRELDELTFEFDFQQEIAGPLNLLGVLPTTVNDDGTRVFKLTMGDISTEEMQRLEYNNEWYRKAPWGTFDPATVDAGRLELIELGIAAEPRSADAWIDYAKLIDDGVLDIGVHFGWDYHKAYHLIHSQSVYNKLVREGFKSPVGSYDELTRSSGPLVRNLLTPEGPIEVRISLYWGKPGTETDPDTDAGGKALEEDMRTSFKDRDVIVFSGHSGPFYAFALANWRKTDEGDLDDSEIPSLEMPDRYQVVLAEGCDTYAVGQAFFMNPAKRDRSLVDVITTTSFSNAGTADTVSDFLDAFIQTDANDVPVAPRLSALLSNLDRNSSWFTTMYGIHGIDDNPHVHPWAQTDKICAPCAADTDCGGVGNRCVTLADGAKACTVECTADDACGAGFLCQAARTGNWITTSVCVTQNATCEIVDEGPVALKIVRVVPNPATDLNGDGVHDVRDDELVEITNPTNRTADLSGWAINDNVGVRFTFPNGFTLEPGASVTVFGGGDAQWTAPRGLGLNNTGDTVTLTDARGAKIAAVSWLRANPGDTVAGN